MNRTCLLPALVLAVGALARAAAAGPLIVTEVVTDPQGDHSENAGGNGVPWDSVPGTGTISTVDEFVEIYNGGDAPIDLVGYWLEFADSSPTTFVFGAATSAHVAFSAGSSLGALLPGGFALVGNPAGSLNNQVDIALRDLEGTLLDLLRVLDGNASSAEDEAITRIWDGVRFLDETTRAGITPLAPPEVPPLPVAVPEPSGPWYGGLLISLFLVARSSVRRARRAERRRGCA